MISSSSAGRSGIALLRGTRKTSNHVADLRKLSTVNEGSINGNCPPRVRGVPGFQASEIRVRTEFCSANASNTSSRLYNLVDDCTALRLP